MSILGSLLGSLYGDWKGPNVEDRRSAEQIAREIVQKYRQRTKGGLFRVDEHLSADLSHYLPKNAVSEVIIRFQERRSRSDDKAEQKLGAEIAIAIDDARHWCDTARPIVR